MAKVSHRKLYPATRGKGGYHNVVLSFVHCFQLSNQEFNPVLCQKIKRKCIFFFFEPLHDLKQY